jgi:multiple sugar transport system permease protein
MAPWGIWAIPKLRTMPGFRFAVLPYPAPAGARSVERASAFIGTAGFMILRQRDEDKRELCMELARFLTRPEAQTDLAHYGVFPSRKSTGNIYPDDELMVQAQEIITSGQTVPRHRLWARIDEKLQREFQLALLGEKSVETAISDGTSQVGKILEQAKEQPPSESASARQSGTLVLVSATLLIGGLLFVSAAVVARKSSAALAFAWLFLCPAVIVFLIFLLFPLCWVMLLAFQNYSLAGVSPAWTGLENLKSVLREPVFMKAAFNTLVYAAVVVPVNTFSALVVASFIYPLSDRARALFRGAYYLPGVASVLVIAMVWRWLFNESFGLFNTALGFFGLPGIRWLTDPGVALWSIILTSVARPPGGPILIYLAALDAIPTSLFDAAEIDGAGPVRKWWHVTVPLLRPTTLFIALTITIAAFQVFAQVFILTDGGPGYATEVIVHRIYTTAIRDFEFGAASAMSFILFGVIMLASIVQYRFLRSEVQY